MAKKLIGWTIILFEQEKEVCRTYYKVEQEAFMRSCLLIYVVEGKTVKVEPEFCVPRVRPVGWVKPE